MPPRPAERAQSLADEVALSLEDEIIAGRLRPRERLIEVELAARYGVSRAPIREALRMIERDGLIAKTTQGYEVADLSAAEAADIFEILAHLEELYTRRATPHIDQDGLRRMRQAIDAMAAAVRGNDIADYYVRNLDFHGVIGAACPNRSLMDLLASLGKKTLRLRRLAMSIPGRMPASLSEHRQIYAAIRAGDAELAGRRARESAENAHVALANLLKHTSTLP